MLKSILVLGVALLLFGCSVDELPGCNGNGGINKICKEYQYLHGDFNGLNEYFYDLSGEDLLIKTTKNPSGTEEGSAYYFYNSNGSYSHIELRKSNGEVLQTQAFTYGSANELLKDEVSGDYNYSVSYKYDDGGVLIAKEYRNDGVLSGIDSLEYYTNSSALYRTVKYQNGGIHSIIYREWFGDELKKEVTYNDQGEKLGSEIERFNKLGILIEEIEYTSNDNLKTKTKYFFDGDLLTEVVKYDEDEVEFERLVYQRY